GNLFDFLEHFKLTAPALAVFGCEDDAVVVEDSGFKELLPSLNNAIDLTLDSNHIASRDELGLDEILNERYGFGCGRDRWGSLFLFEESRRHEIERRLDGWSCLMRGRRDESRNRSLVWSRGCGRRDWRWFGKRHCV